MKSIIINYLMNLIKKYYNYDKTKLDEIKYGLETLYLTITKTIVIFTIAYLLHLTKELLLIFLFYGILRMFSFGLHASKGWQCWVYSIISFIGLSYISTAVQIDEVLKIIIPSICIILLAIYSPADTEKRPIISKKRRIFFKISTILISITYFTFILTIKNNLYINILVISLMIQTAMVLPISYKVFKLRYNNYKYYNQIS